MTTNSPIPPTMEEPLRDELRALAEKNPGKWFNVSYRLTFHNGHFYFDALSATASDCPNADPLVKHLQQQVERLREALKMLIARYRGTTEEFEYRSCYAEMIVEIELAEKALAGEE